MRSSGNKYAFPVSSREQHKVKKKQRSQGRKEGKGREKKRGEKRMDHGNNPQKCQYLSIMQKQPTEETESTGYNREWDLGSSAGKQMSIPQKRGR